MPPNFRKLDWSCKECQHLCCKIIKGSSVFTCVKYEFTIDIKTTFLHNIICDGFGEKR